jgi:hypothetical protein
MSRRGHRVFQALLLSIGLTGAPGALAVVLPDFSGSAGCTGAPTAGSTPGNATCQVDFSPLLSDQSASFNLAGLGNSVLATVNTSGFSTPPFSGGFSADASASLQYYVAVIGPPGGIAAVRIQAQGSTAASGDSASAIADLSLDGGAVFKFGCSRAGVAGACIDLGSPPGQPIVPSSSWVLNAVFASAVDEVHIVSMGTDAQVGNNGSATAFVDPFFEIDPSTPNAELYSLVFSTGVGPGVPLFAPEPGMVTLIALGVTLALRGRH